MEKFYQSRKENIIGIDSSTSFVHIHLENWDNFTFSDVCCEMASRLTDGRMLTSQMGSPESVPCALTPKSYLLYWVMVSFEK